MQRTKELYLLILTAAALAVGGVLYAAGSHDGAHIVWAAATVVGVLPAMWWVLDAARHGRLGVDVVALLALVGTLVVGEYFAGAVVAVMLASGRTLEAIAATRARRELRSLLERAPRIVHRYADGELTSPSLEDVRRGDLLLVEPGEVVPVDGLLERAVAILDESALTGEPLPVEREVGDTVRSGVLNAGGPFDLRATTSAGESTYAGIVRLVSEAEASSAPFVRLADRYAGAFLLVSLVLAGAAWAMSGDLVRAIAVLVVATPCPLILAAPVAIVSGLSRAARRGVVVKGGAALEQLARGEILLFDKTGTITAGRPTLSEVVTAGTLDEHEILRLAASLDQVSPHVLAAAVVRAALARSPLALSLPSDVEEVAGHGVRGFVDGRHVAVGKASWASPLLTERWVRADSEAGRARQPAHRVRAGRRGAGGRAALRRSDPHRRGAHDPPVATRRYPPDRDGDRRSRGNGAGSRRGRGCRRRARGTHSCREGRRGAARAQIGTDDHGGRRHQRRARARTGRRRGGDRRTRFDSIVRSGGCRAHCRPARPARRGDSDRPPITAHRVRERHCRYRIVDGSDDRRRVRLPPAGGRCAAPGAHRRRRDPQRVAQALRDSAASSRLAGPDAALTRRFSAEHAKLRPDVARLRAVADALDPSCPAEALAMSKDVHRFLVEELGPHEEAEDSVLYPVLARVLGGNDPTGTMSRAHVEIAHLIRRLGRVLDNVEPEGPDAEDITELRRLLYGLHAILQLHFAQEDEGYLSLVDEESPTAPSGL